MMVKYLREVHTNWMGHIKKQMPRGLHRHLDGKKFKFDEQGHDFKYDKQVREIREMIKKATHQDQLFYSPLRSFATETSPRHLIGHKNKESSSNIQNPTNKIYQSPYTQYTRASQRRLMKQSLDIGTAASKIDTIDRSPNSPRETEMKIFLQTPYHTHSLTYKYNAATTVGDFVKYLKDIVGTKNILFKSGNTMLDFVLTLDNLNVSLLSCHQPLNLRTQTINVPNRLPQNSLKRFNIIRCIGSGGFSKVFLAETNGVYIALKIIDKDFLVQNEKQVIVQNERKILVELNHPFITKVHYTIETERYVAIAMEYCSGGELFYLLKKVKRMKESQARFYFLEVLAAIKALHDKNMVYRDLKPQNIILDYEGHIRLADFGLSKIMDNELTHSFCGSAQYMAPEMLGRGGHNYSVDYYCIGALLYELVTGLPPYYSKDQKELFQNILKNTLQFPDKVPLSTEIKSFLSQLLIKNPEMRLGSVGGIAQIWSHPWVAGICFEDVLAKKLMPPFKPDTFQENFDNSEFKNQESQILQQLERQKIYGDLKKPYLHDFFFESEEMRQKREYILREIGKSTRLSSPSPFSQHNVEIQQKARKSENIKDSTIMRPSSPEGRKFPFDKPNPYNRSIPELYRYKSQANLRYDQQNYSVRNSSQDRKDLKYRDFSTNKFRFDSPSRFGDYKSTEIKRNRENMNFMKPIPYHKSPSNPYLSFNSSTNLSSQKRPHSHRNLDSSATKRYQSPITKQSYIRPEPPKNELKRGYFNKEKLKNYFTKKY